jgi:predicted small secreted protein
MAWVALAALFALVFLLSGCDTVTGYGDRINDQFPGSVCRNYAVEQDSRITVQDSTKSCADGTAPFFYYADWISTSGECLVTPSDVRGGLSGIKRTFGCWPKSAFPQVVI